MRLRARLWCAALLTAGLAATLHAWQWPVSGPALHATFGTEAGGFVLRGVQIEGSEPGVYPVEAGVVVAVVARRDGSDSGLPSALGSYVVVDHDNSFRSVYAHLEPGYLPAVGQVVGPATRIGTVGSSGQIDRRSLRLYVIDLESGEYVNPLLLLPDLPDRSAPQVLEVYAADGEVLFDVRLLHELLPGPYEIVARIWDRAAPATGAVGFAPYSVRFVAGGQEIFAVTKDRMRIEPQAARVEPGAINTQALYNADGLYRLGTIEVPHGSIEITIIARDLAGNATTFTTNISSRTEEASE